MKSKFALAPMTDSVGEIDQFFRRCLGSTQQFLSAGITFRR